jgi:hypothetical protein
MLWRPVACGYQRVCWLGLAWLGNGHDGWAWLLRFPFDLAWRLRGFRLLVGRGLRLGYCGLGALGVGRQAAGSLPAPRGPGPSAAAPAGPGPCPRHVKPASESCAVCEVRRHAAETGSVGFPSGARLDFRFGPDWISDSGSTGFPSRDRLGFRVGLDWVSESGSTGFPSRARLGFRIGLDWVFESGSTGFPNRDRLGFRV